MYRPAALGEKGSRWGSSLTIQQNRAGRRPACTSASLLHRPPPCVPIIGDYVLVLFDPLHQDHPTARSSAAVKRPPAPSPSSPAPPAPAGGFARRPPSQRPEKARPRPAAADLDALPDAEVAVEDARRRGRGAQSNATGRYEPLARIAFDDGWQSFEELPPFKTTVTIDSTRKIIARNDSPDISFDRSINPYRGCEHGCIYCFARPTHAYLGLSPGLDFETKLFAKPDAPKLL